jgi:DNA-binding transcriptional ArsR family regulator
MMFETLNPIRSLFVDVTQNIENNSLQEASTLPRRLRLMGSIVSLINSHSCDSDENGPAMILDDGTDLVFVQLSRFIMNQFVAKNFRCQNLYGDDNSLLQDLNDNSTDIDRFLGVVVDCVVRVEYKTNMPDIPMNQSDITFPSRQISETCRYVLHGERINFVTNPNDELLRWLELSFHKNQDRPHQLFTPPANRGGIFRNESKVVRSHIDEIFLINDVSEYNTDFGYPMKNYSTADIYRMILSEYKDESGVNKNSSIVYNGISAHDISLCLDMNIASVEEHLAVLQNTGHICQNKKGRFVPTYQRDSRKKE